MMNLRIFAGVAFLAILLAGCAPASASPEPVTVTPEIMPRLDPSPTPSGSSLPLTCQVTDLNVYVNEAEVVFIGVTGKKVPLLSSVRVDIVLLVLIGMAICTQGGIGRVAAMGTWTHPLAIIGYILGGSILLVTLAVFTGWKLPFIQTDQQALLAIAILASLKVVNAVTHYLLAGISS